MKNKSASERNEPDSSRKEHPDAAHDLYGIEITKSSTSLGKYGHSRFNR